MEKKQEVEGQKCLQGPAARLTQVAERICRLKNKSFFWLEEKGGSFQTHPKLSLQQQQFTSPQPGLHGHHGDAFYQ